MSDLLVAKNLTKQYGNKIALNDFNLTIPKGSVYGLLGPNGAGKTTFLRIINQITAPDKGNVMVAGKPLDKSVIPMVGYMPEERGLYNNMKIGEQALYFAKLKGLSDSEAKKKTEYWFEKLGIAEWWNKKLNELSKGMGQKVQFVITVLHDPELLIFDEPFSGFDPVNAQIIANEILELRDKGTTIIFSTHRMESVEEMCDYIALINKSNKILDGSVQNVKRQFKTGKFFAEVENVMEDAWMNFQNAFDAESVKKDEYSLQFTLKKPDHMTTNQLLQQLTQLGNVVQYKEAIPSMHEVFLNAVKNSEF